MIDIKIDNHIFKISNQDKKKTLEAPKFHWRKTPGQIQRDQERQQNFFAKKKNTDEVKNVPLASEDDINDQAHKVILTKPS